MTAVLVPLLTSPEETLISITGGSTQFSLLLLLLLPLLCLLPLFSLLIPISSKLNFEKKY